MLKTKHVWLIFLFTTIGFAQKRASLDSILNLKIPKAERLILADSLLDVTSENPKDSLEYLLNDYAYEFYSPKNVSIIIPYQIKSINLFKSRDSIDLNMIQNGYLDLGYYYKKNSQPLKSIEAYNESLTYNKANANAITAYKNLGLLYKNTNDYHRALMHYDLALSLYKKRSLNDRDKRSFLITYINAISTCYQLETKEGFEKGYAYIKESQDLLKQIKGLDKYRYTLNSNSATLYNNYYTLDLDKSIGFYNKALVIANKLNDTAKIRDTYIVIGNLYNSVDPKKAISFQEKALKLTNEKETKALHLIYTNLGEAYEQKGDFEKSIELRLKALQYLTNIDFSNDTLNFKNLLIDFQDKKELIDVIPQLAKTYLKSYKLKKDKALLKKSITYFKVTDEIIDLLKINSKEYKSKLFWRALSSSIYSNAIEACYLDNNLDMAFYFMEKNKALLLIEDITKQKYKEAIKTSSKYIKEEEELNKNIFKIENEIKEGVNNIDSLKLLELEYKTKLYKLQDSIYGSFEYERINTSIFNLKSAKKQLTDNQVIIEYYIPSDNTFEELNVIKNGYAIVITNKKSLLVEINNLKTLENEVSSLIKSLRTPFQNIDDKVKFHKNSQSVFNMLFPTKEIKNLIANKELTIIPNNYLSLLPFETLITSDEDNSYLIKSSDIHYQYSNSFLNNLENKKDNSSSFLGMAPISFLDKELTPLEHSKKEILTIKNFIKGKTYFNKKATKSNFLKDISNHDIIHLATHADAQNVTLPWVAFNDGKLSLEELYLTKNKAQMVVLSGCNTSLGTLEAGEGIMSLARGFFYSGSQSVVSTLWNIDDKSSSFIMEEFYKNLASGKTKSKSLRNAKLKFLETTHGAEVAPHFWASFIILGDNEALNINKNQYIYILGILTFVIIISTIVYKQIKKSYYS